MKKAYDRITEAYYDNLGNEFGVKVRDRIHWICEQATGEVILDVGCSQGITAILLGREGKKVCGVDLNSDAISYANEMLAKEEYSTKENVQFYAGNYMNMTFDDEKFDSIIFGEILEHITDPKRFIRKASDKLIKDNGKIIITLPFGINNYHDHKKTYYLQDVLDFQVDELVIDEIRFLGKWIGITLKKDQKEKKLTPNENLLRDLEKEFYSIEGTLLSKVEALSSELKKSQTDLNQLTNDFENKIQEMKKAAHLQETVVESLRSQAEEEKNYHEGITRDIKKQLNVEIAKNQELHKRITQLEGNGPKTDINHKEVAKLTSEVNDLRKKERNYQSQLILERKNKIHAEEQLLASYKKEEALLKSYKVLLKKYTSLSNSKLGKLTLSYWKKRKRLVGGK